MRFTLTKVSFPRDYQGMTEYLLQEFGTLLPNQAATVMALPPGASFFTMDGGKLTIVTLDMLDSAVQSIAEDCRRFAGDMPAGERFYLLIGKVLGTYLDDLRTGAEEPESQDAEALRRWLRAA